MSDSIEVKRVFTESIDSLNDVFSRLSWSKKNCKIEGKDGVVFEQNNVEAPHDWSDTSVNITASKYFRGRLGTPERENSVKQLITRIVDTIGAWGSEDGYFADTETEIRFCNELAYILVSQRAAFNSPVWFNVGVEKEPQCSACFINSVEDTMESILELTKTEGMIFKNGSGAGVNVSNIRGKNEYLSGGGLASGPLSFMKGFDTFAGAIKSGGRTRRAARIVLMNINHPDIVDFINCKRTEEDKARKLVDAGYDNAIDGEAYASVFHQNANHSVRVTDEFMRAVETGEDWPLISRKTGENMGHIKADKLFNFIVENAHACGDPGLQFDNAANNWNTCSTSGRINSSNPCAEFMFLDNSACNLASINLMKFLDDKGKFLIEEFIQVVEIMILAQDIIIDRASYPTGKIKYNSINFRPLGLGYTNLGAFLMCNALPYDSEDGRNYAAVITALMTGVAYRRSSEIARQVGAFHKYQENVTSMKCVIEKHSDYVNDINYKSPPYNIDLLNITREIWNKLRYSNVFYRNAQVTLLAPTGTISFMMGAATTGIEPDISLLKVKKLVGGGILKYENQYIERALKVLKYSEEETRQVIEYLKDHGTLADADGYVSPLPEEHFEVFNCALEDQAGVCINWSGHIMMLASVQPFLSGSISKTVNIPKTATTKVISNIYKTAWKMGLKAISIYRDGCKESQPMESGSKKETEKLILDEMIKKAGNTVEEILIDSNKIEMEQVIGRKKMPETRESITHKINIAGHEGYITAGMYDDGRLGEIFICMAKTGSTVSGLLDAFATSTSIAFQYGVPFEVLKDKFIRTRFEPSGFISNPDLPGVATSVLDYIFRWLEIEFPGGIRRNKVVIDESILKDHPIHLKKYKDSKISFDSGPPCTDCGSIMQPNGNCHICPTCGTTNGCS
jgi:ribonucleoside-diphosphate reductase alpha chain